ncbi:MAG: hypothetical protein L0215_00375 [Gemmataceae bacterium]|nr:hypothetical protein [Gemmataceae bacterium]
MAQFTIQGRGLRCQHCGGEEFQQKSGSVDKVGCSFVYSDDYWGHQVTIFVCDGCGLAHFFMTPAEGNLAVRESVENMPTAEEMACLSCGAKILPEATACPECGWTWTGESAPGNEEKQAE